MSKPRTYSEFRCYSPLHDCEISRVSMTNDRGQEFFIEVPGDGKAYREAKRQALEDLAAAIETGHEPGRVVQKAKKVNP
jgi:hypothetical protein